MTQEQSNELTRRAGEWVEAAVHRHAALTSRLPNDVVLGACERAIAAYKSFRDYLASLTDTPK